jgi:hypothetical protein
MSAATVAFITPSYAGDLERCQLLCESLDMMAEMPFDHYILVADHDLALFKPLAGGKRQVIAESDVLPSWLKVMKRPFGGGRHAWVSLSPPVWPMSGWHVQQLRKILIAKHISDEVMVMADSDSLFIRPFGLETFMRDGKVRLHVQEAGIKASGNVANHEEWVVNAARILDLPAPVFPADDYINNLVSWRRELVLAMIRRIEEHSGRDLVAALGRQRSFSEYQMYGAFVVSVLGGEGHFRMSTALSHTYWAGDALSEATLTEFVTGLHPEQIAIGVQSFTGTPTALLRRYLSGLAKAR